MSVTLRGGPMDGREVDDYLAPRLVFPLTGMNDDGSDMYLSEASYDRHGAYIDTVVKTTTWNADMARRQAEWWARQDRKDALISRLLDEGVITEDDL